MTTGKDAEATRKIRVLFIAWFVRPDRLWLGEFMDPERYECGYVGLPYPLDMTSKRTNLKKWRAFFHLAVKARAHLLTHRYDVVVTSYPQVAFAFRMVALLTGQQTPHIAWLFNMGHSYQGSMRRLASIAFKGVNRFIVYTRKECVSYAKTLELPADRFYFTYLTGDVFHKEAYAGTRAALDLPARYIAALGSSSRDYGTLFRAVEGLDTQVVVVTHAYALQGLTPPPNVRIMQSISQADYLGILANAEVCIIPVNNVETASGQLTLVQAMQLETPIVATRCIGTEDYIEDGKTGIFVEMGDDAAMRTAISSLLENDTLRNEITRNAQDFAKKNLVEAAGARVLDSLCIAMNLDKS